MFYKVKLKCLKKDFDKKVDISTNKNSEFNLPLVNAKDGNNGIMYYGRYENFESVEMSIDIVNDGAVSTGNVYPQPQRTGVLYNAYLIKFKDTISKEVLFFLSSSIKKSIKNKFGYENKASWEKVKNETIKLPTKNGEIDFDFMEEFISELEEIKLKRVKRYLKDNNLDNFELNKQEKEALEKFENNLVEWKEFRIGDLFEIKTPKKKFDANKVKVFEKGKYPYVVRTSVNNGIRGYLNEDEKFLNEGNTLSFGQDTATIFYQPISYFTGDKIKILKSKFNSFNKIQAMFYLVGIRKSFSVFSWGSSSFNVKVISNQTIKLPIKNGEIDFDFMENLVKAIQKKIIKKLIKRYNLAGKSI